MLAILMIYRCAGKYQETVIEDSSPIFPKFYEESKKEKKKADKKDSKGNSLVSKFFGDIYKEITKFFDDIDVEDPLLADDARLNPKISSHSGKRKAAQWLAELCVSTFSALYQLGYLLHSVSSIIECNYFFLFYMLHLCQHCLMFHSFSLLFIHSIIFILAKYLF